MKKVILMIFLLVLPATAYAQPSIVFDSEKYDFGVIAPGDSVEHSFDFVNKGDRDLVIQRLAPS